MSKVQLLSGLGHRPRYETKKNVVLVKKQPSKIAKLTKKVNKLASSIPVNHDIVNAGTTISTSGTAWYFNTFTLGDTYNSREGENITMKRFKMSANFVASDSYNYIRYILMIVKENRGQGIVLADILATPTNPINSQYVYEYQKRYKILKDKVVYSESTAGSGKQSVFTRFNVNLKNYKTQYNSGNAGTYADIDKGLLVLLAVSDSSAVNHPALNFNSILTYSP